MALLMPITTGWMKMEKRSITSITSITDQFYRLHPLVLLEYVMLIMLVLMFCQHPLIMSEALIVGGSYFALIDRQSLKRMCQYMVLLIVICGLINSLTYHDGVTVLFYINDNAMTVQAIFYGVVIGLMIVNAILWLIIYGKFLSEEKLLYLFGRVSPTFALMISMVFAYIPLLKERYANVHNANRSMGVYQHATKKEQLRLRAREISTVISWSLEQSIDTAQYMQARGYGQKTRTTYHRYVMTVQDKRWLVILSLLGVMLITFLCLGWGKVFFYPVLEYKETAVKQGVLLGTFFLLLVLPALWHISYIRKGMRYDSI